MNFFLRLHVLILPILHFRYCLSALGRKQWILIFCLYFYERDTISIIVSHTWDNTFQKFKKLKSCF